MLSFKNIFAFCLILLMPIMAFSQESITLEQCISNALQNNYSVKISGNELQIAENNVTYSSFLPTVTLGSRQSSSSSNQKNINNVGERENSTLSGGSIINSANLSWRLFDGLSMFAVREKQNDLKIHEE
jgi:outer membrane protein TolC